jgi:mono/diheme cytochrome c family protein
MVRGLVASIVTMMLALNPCVGHAQFRAPDPQHGYDLAGRLCAACHIIGPDHTGATRPDVPSFVAIAQILKATPGRIAGAIVLPHPAMPGIPLTQPEIRDITAYIMSLNPEP